VLKLFKDIYFHFIFKLALLLLLLFLFIYSVLHTASIGENIAWLLIFFAFLLSFGTIFFMAYRLYKKLKEDIDSLSDYLKKIDAKEYDAEIKITHYIDFLELSLLLKNLVKRVYQREKKSSKK
jgi:hypothetical protein